MSTGQLDFLNNTENMKKNLALKRRVVGGGGWVKEAADGIAGRLPLLLLAAHLLHQPVRRVLAVEARHVVVVVHQPTRLAALRLVPPPAKRM